MIAGHCACGGLTVTLARLPDYLNACNCSLCQRTGAVWGYFAPHEVTVGGESRRFVRGDTVDPCLATLFCPDCGHTAAWVALDPGYDRMGVNMRLFEPHRLRSIECRFPDGLNRTDDTDPAWRRPAMPYGESDLS